MVIHKNNEYPSLKKSWAVTDRGKAPNLFDVLLVALGAGWSPWRASGVPEGVVVLKRVLTWPWYHHLWTGGKLSKLHGHMLQTLMSQALSDTAGSPFSWRYFGPCPGLQFFPSHRLSVSLGPGRGLHCHHLSAWIWQKQIFHSQVISKVVVNWWGFFSSQCWYFECRKADGRHT